LNFSDFGREFSELIGRAAPVLLGLGVVVSGPGILEVYREKGRGMVAVRLEAPDGRIPEGGAVAIAVDEEDGTRGLGGSVDREEQQKKQGQEETTSESTARPSVRPGSPPGPVPYSS